MKRLRIALLTVYMLAICAALGSYTTTAQQATSGSATAAISPAAAPATTNSSGSYPRLPWEFQGESNPLQQADGNHSELTRRLLAQYQATTDSEERTKLRDEMEKVITEHFEVRQKIRAQELEELQTQIRRLQELHDRRQQEKSQIISDRLRQMLRDADGLGWGAGDAVGTTVLGTTRSPYAQPARSVAPAAMPK